MAIAAIIIGSLGLLTLVFFNWLDIYLYMCKRWSLIFSIQTRNKNWSVKELPKPISIWKNWKCYFWIVSVLQWGCLVFSIMSIAFAAISLSSITHDTGFYQVIYVLPVWYCFMLFFSFFKYKWFYLEVNIR